MYEVENHNEIQALKIKMTVHLLNETVKYATHEVAVGQFLVRTVYYS